MKYLNLDGLARFKSKLIELIPTKTSQLTNNSNFVSDSSYNHTDNNFTTALKNKLDGIANGATANTGTITGITMNGSSKGTSGVVDLGNIITQHQNISGKADVNHTHSMKDLWIPTDAVQNGGPGSVDRFGLAETRACKTAFMPPEAITIEYTTDGGATWIDYGASDAAKKELVACRYSGSFKYGGPSCTTVTNKIGLRITLNPTDRYCYVNMAYLWVNSVAHTCMVSLERSTIGNKTTFTPVNNGKQYQITGWTGGNMLYFPGSTFGGGSTQYSNTYAYRFTFLCTGINSDWLNSVPSIIDLRMYGTSTWIAPNEMMKTDHLYYWDSNKNATFPAAVTAPNFSGKINNHTVNKDVPSDAKFTDTTYNNATTSVGGLMSSTDKTKLDGIANGATANIGTITGITMNGTSKGTSGVVDLGTVITAHQDIVYLIDTGSDISTFTNSGTYLIDATLNMSYTYMFGPSGNQIRATSLIPLCKGDILFCSMDSTYIYWTIYAYSDNKKWIVKCTKSTGYSTGNYSTLLDTIGGDNLPVGTEVEYNGDVEDIPEDWELASNYTNTIAKLYLTGDNIDLTASSNYKNIRLPLTGTSIIGDKLSFDTTNKQIIIGEGVHHIKISAQMIMSYHSTNKLYGLRIAKNNGATEVVSSYRVITDQSFESFYIPSSIFEVSPGDKIEAYVYIDENGGKVRLRSYNESTFLQVEVVE